jgi:hypothetical protein
VEKKKPSPPIFNKAAKIILASLKKEIALYMKGG